MKQDKHILQYINIIDASTFCYRLFYNKKTLASIIFVF